MSANQRRTPAEQYLDPKPHFGVPQDDQRSTTFPSFRDWHMRHRAEMEKLDAQIAGLRAERADRDLRDRFAMAALTGMLPKLPLVDQQGVHGAAVPDKIAHNRDIAESCYWIADAMLAARKQ